MKKRLKEFFESIKKNPGKTAGWVYFIIEAGRFTAVKIGFSGNPRKRLKGLQGANRRLLEILAFVPAFKEHEQWLHDMLKTWRIRGEWYSCNKTTIGFIRDATKIIGNYPILEQKIEQGSRRGGGGFLEDLQDKNMVCTMNNLLRSDGGDIPAPFDYNAYAEAIQDASRIEDNLLEIIELYGAAK